MKRERDQLPVTPLEPCPCCGYRAEIEQVPHDPEGPNSGGYYIECKRAGCGITTRLAFAAMDDPLPGLIQSWNRRCARSEIAASVPASVTISYGAQTCDPKGRAFAPTTGASTCYLCGAYAAFNETLICKRTGTAAVPVAQWFKGKIVRVDQHGIFYLEANGSHYVCGFDRVKDENGRVYGGQPPKEFGMREGREVIVGIIDAKVDSARLA